MVSKSTQADRLQQYLKAISEVTDLIESVQEDFPDFKAKINLNWMVDVDDRTTMDYVGYCTLDTETSFEAVHTSLEYAESRLPEVRRFGAFLQHGLPFKARCISDLEINPDLGFSAAACELMVGELYTVVGHEMCGNQILFEIDELFGVNDEPALLPSYMFSVSEQIGQN